MKGLQILFEGNCTVLSIWIDSVFIDEIIRDNIQHFYLGATFKWGVYHVALMKLLKTIYIYICMAIIYVTK